VRETGLETVGFDVDGHVGRLPMQRAVVRLPKRPGASTAVPGGGQATHETSVFELAPRNPHSRVPGRRRK
jgi:hypothetical protein